MSRVKLARTMPWREMVQGHTREIGGSMDEIAYGDICECERCSLPLQ